MGTDPRGPDYGVVDLVNLFAQATAGVPFSRLPKSRHREFYGRFEHSISDHLPIWVRIPLPDLPGRAGV